MKGYRPRDFASAIYPPLRVSTYRVRIEGSRLKVLDRAADCSEKGGRYNATRGSRQGARRHSNEGPSADDASEERAKGPSSAYEEKEARESDVAEGRDEGFLAASLDPGSNNVSSVDCCRMAFLSTRPPGSGKNYDSANEIQERGSRSLYPPYRFGSCLPSLTLSPSFASRTLHQDQRERERERE
jgi:hypothetical protein